VEDLDPDELMAGLRIQGRFFKSATSRLGTRELTF
jgi:hypothetical protein